MEITLIRHGKPGVELKGLARARDLPGIADSYNRSGIIDLPPEETLQQSSKSDFAICSHLPRSIKYAEALGFNNIPVCDSLYREIELPHFSRGPIILPISAWVILLRVLSLLGFSKNGESFSMARERASQATTQLIEHANEYQSVVLVGHGFLNYLIAKELINRNWTGPAKPGSQYWDYAVYRTDK